MLLGMTLALVLWQAPPTWQSGLPVTPPPREWSLGNAFILKQEKFLRWQPVVDPLHPYKGWTVEPRPTWLLELRPTHPRLAGVSLSVESMPATGAGIGIVRPRFQFRLPKSGVQIGVTSTVLAFFSSAFPGGMRMTRPMLTGSF